MPIRDLILDCLGRPRDAVFHSLSRALAEAFPDRHLLETESRVFDVLAYAGHGGCRVEPRPDVHGQWDTWWDGRHERIHVLPFQVWLRIEWEGRGLELVRVAISGQSCRTERSFLLSPSLEVGRGFFEAVCRWNSEVRGEVLVFDGTSWSKRSDLHDEIASTTLDDLVLAGDLKAAIHRDFRQFFGAEEAYARYGVPWKRGVLFLGPPGNGKTHMVKALINDLARPCLYVRSLESFARTVHGAIEAVFERARETAPCLLVLEDLDALIDDDNRSFFLNELDGFAQNRGILTVATTNHPERLDPAILDRPSRFDRKYVFGPPASPERRTYLWRWNERLEPGLRMTTDGHDLVVEATEGFSFAYLKELLVASMMDWMATPEERTMDQVALTQARLLAQQIQAGHDILGLDRPPPDDSGGPFPFPPSWGRRRRRSR